ncbi:hypothetical protein UR09_00280 [Candidatus Nitromaritima sp. SCGC AAA799-A02]|nr:hypothetical protein UZ36_05920 [Candidatus Nitromaritima sp. SCGC AAA799-C22]KMP12753.1 hypothetical protein UR09_00280 [Candidatus Nitromaritima sp. SCGC AAA799-A02]
MRSPAPIPFYAFLACAVLILSQCSSKSSDELVREGIEYTNQGEYDRALEAFLNATGKDPKNPQAFYGLGGIYNYQNRHQEAVEAFKTTIRLDPTHFNARYSLGFTYEQLGRKELAQKEFARYKSLKQRFETLVDKEQEKS